MDLHLPKLNGNLRKGDNTIFVVAVLLAVISFLSVSSSTSALVYQKAHGNIGFYILHHGKMIIAAMGCMIGFSHVRAGRFFEFAPIALFLSILAVAMTWVMGSSINGSSRWLTLGGIMFQPSEIAKFAIITFAANRFAKYGKDPGRAFLQVLAALVVLLMFIVPQNLSTGLLIGASTCFMFVVGRTPWRYLLILFAAIVCVLAIFWFCQDIVKSVFPRAETWYNRIERFGSDEEGLSGNEQAHQAIAAVSLGGPLGVGLGHSYIKNILPMAYSDFIFSIILEETGILGMALVMGCYIVLFTRARYLAFQSRYPFSRYLIIGIATVICFQALINMAVGVGVIPVTGQTLPMVSMGGTSNCMTGIVFGMMLSVSDEISNETPPRKA